MWHYEKRRNIWKHNSTRWSVWSNKVLLRYRFYCTYSSVVSSRLRLASSCRRLTWAIRCCKFCCSNKFFIASPIIFCWKGNLPMFCKSSSGLGKFVSSGLGDLTFFSPGENWPESSAELFESREVASATEDWRARGGVFGAGGVFMAWLPGCICWLRWLRKPSTDWRAANFGLMGAVALFSARLAASSYRHKCLSRLVYTLRWLTLMRFCNCGLMWLRPSGGRGSAGSCPRTPGNMFGKACAKPGFAAL